MPKKVWSARTPGFDPFREESVYPLPLPANSLPGLHPPDLGSKLSDPFGISAVLPCRVDLQVAVDLLKLDVGSACLSLKEAAN